MRTRVSVPCVNSKDGGSLRSPRRPQSHAEQVQVSQGRETDLSRKVSPDRAQLRQWGAEGHRGGQWGGVSGGHRGGQWGTQRGTQRDTEGVSGGQSVRDTEGHRGGRRQTGAVCLFLATFMETSAPVTSQ